MTENDVDKYLNAKLAFKRELVEILTASSVSLDVIQEEVIEYIEYDEPQIAYTAMVALLVDADKELSHQDFVKIVEMGKELQITNGITWDEEQADIWWGKLKKLTKG